MRHRMGEFSKSLSDYFAAFDKRLLVIALLLSGYGLLAINTATASKALHNRYVLVHLLGVVAGLLVVFVLSKFDYTFLGYFSFPISGISK